MIPADADWVLPDGSIDPAAFYRRPIDKGGVSVATTVASGMERMKKRGVVAIRSLLVGWVREIEPAGKLDVRSKSAEHTHADITGLPYEHEDPKEAENFAKKLRKIARPVPLP